VPCGHTLCGPCWIQCEKDTCPVCREYVSDGVVPVVARAQALQGASAEQREIDATFMASYKPKTCKKIAKSNVVNITQVIDAVAYFREHRFDDICRFNVFIGVLLFLVVCIVLSHVDSPVPPGYTRTLNGYTINCNVLLCIGTLFIAWYLMLGCIERDGFNIEIETRYRRMRWVSHLFYMGFYCAALCLLFPINTISTLVAISLFTGCTLALLQSSNEASASIGGGGERHRVWLVMTMIFVGFLLFFITFIADSADRRDLWIPTLAIGWYYGLHAVVGAVTNWPPPFITPSGRECVFVLWEFGLAVFLHVAMFNKARVRV